MSQTTKERISREPVASRDNRAEAESDAEISAKGNKEVQSSGSEAEDERRGLSVLPLEIEPLQRLEMPQWVDPKLLDGVFQAALGRLTFSVTPAGIASTYYTWLSQLMLSPGKQLELVQKAVTGQAELARYGASLLVDPNAEPCCVEPLPNDRRFDGDEWSQWPYNLISQSFLTTQEWWMAATNDVPGVGRADERVVSFVTRQLLDHVAPCNMIPTNPKVARTTLEQGGANLWQGFQHWVEDVDRELTGRPPAGAEAFRPGQEVATTSGRVVYRNRLIELIQYSPRTDKVRPEPILVIPAWIMKYYILDLSPHNSLIGHLVDQGYTVFCISWRNPGPEDRDLGMEDYRQKGVMAALDAVDAIVPDQKVHATGYCLGGTLLAIAAAEMARRGDDRFATLTYFCTQFDFTDAGELMLFISESEVAYLENIMWAEGTLKARQMAGAFQLLRSNDLIWSRYIQEYLMGERQKMFDLMAWNADGTHLPYRMHSEYLRRLLLDNAFAQGKYEIDGRPVSIANVRQPMFSVATEKDHIAPWRSVYKLHLLADTEVTQVLTNGGHNAGIVSEPGHRGRRYRLRTQRPGDHYLDPETWQRKAEQHDGSWWPAWFDWLDRRSGKPTAPPAMGAAEQGYEPLDEAPGSYIHQR